MRLTLTKDYGVPAKEIATGNNMYGTVTVCIHKQWSLRFDTCI
jgi:hypothetical protein